MNQTEYKHIKEFLTTLETTEWSKDWQYLYNSLSWNIPHYSRYARTEAGRKRCEQAVLRFAALRSKSRFGSEAAS